MSFKKRREKHLQKRRAKRKHDTYSLFDFFADVVFYFPELIFLPFRILWYGLRVIFRFFDWT